jgi:hypothetical protein
LPVAGRRHNIHITKYSFADGINSYSSADPNFRVANFNVRTGDSARASFITSTVDVKSSRWRALALSVALSGFALGLFSTSSSAFFFGCGLEGNTTFSPAHPQARDPLTFDIALYHAFVNGDVVLSKTIISPGNQIMFDVVITVPDAVAMFPDYQSYPAVTGAMTYFEGMLGPLAVGQYTVTSSVRTYFPAYGFHKNCDDYTRTFIVYADDGLSPVVEYYYSVLDHYFITQFTDEIAALDAGVHPGWVRTGQSFLAYRPEQGVGLPVQRWYGLPSSGLDTHFFTLGGDDVVFLLNHPSQWERESNAAFAAGFPSVVIEGVGVPGCPSGEVPVYRLWNRRADSNHRYTTDPAIKAQMIAKGSVAEGYGPDAIMMCAFTR